MIQEFGSDVKTLNCKNKEVLFFVSEKYSGIECGHLIRDRRTEWLTKNEREQLKNFNTGV